MQVVLCNRGKMVSRTAGLKRTERLSGYLKTLNEIQKPEQICSAASLIFTPVRIDQIIRIFTVDFLQDRMPARLVQRRTSFRAS